MNAFTVIYTLPIGSYGSSIVSQKIVKTLRHSPTWEQLAKLAKIDSCQIVLVHAGAHECYTGEGNHE